MDMFTEAVALGTLSSLQSGKAAEHLVCADLLLRGYAAFLSDQGMPYDVVVDMDGRLVRVQVKSTCFAKGDAGRQVYWFKPNGKRRLTKVDCDVLALVALDIRTIAYWPISRNTESIKLRPPGSLRLKLGRRPLATIDCYPFSAAVGHG